MKRALILLLLAAVAVAQEQPTKPDTPEQAAEKVLGAIEAGEDAALKVLAEKGSPDPWLVADELCRRGEHDAALAFARAALRDATRTLPAYVSGRVGREDSRKDRDRVRRMEQAWTAKDYAAVLAAGSSES